MSSVELYLISLDSEPNSDLLSDPDITIIPLTSHPKNWQTANRLSFLLLAPIKVLFQIWSLWIVLGYRSQPSEWLIVQVFFDGDLCLV